MKRATTPTSAPVADASEYLDRKVLAIGGVVVLGAIMAMLDISVVNIALDN